MRPAGRHPDLRLRLVGALLGPILLLAGIGAAVDFVVARRLTDDAYDQSIAGVAEGLALMLERDRDRDLALHFQSMMHTLQGIDAPDTWRYLVIDAQGRVVDGDRALLAAAGSASGQANPVFRTLTLGLVPERIATLRSGSREPRATIIVAETLKRRSAAARAIVSATAWPNGVLMVLTVVLVLASIRVAMRPVDRLGRHINAQRADELELLRLDGTPRETLPLLQALNRLIERLRAASTQQQAFLDLAAHQLRTPLAALQARIELLLDTPGDEVAGAANAAGSANAASADGTGSAANAAHPVAAADAAALRAALHADVARLSRLTTQLLTLGRVDRGVAATTDETVVDLPDLVAELAPSFDDRAHALGVQLAFELEPLRVSGFDWMLREAIGNLVHNALTYAPRGSTVTVRCRTQGGGGVVEVEDAGPGIAPDLRERVFEPFVRLSESAGPGSGLGLAIVRSIAERHHARVTIGGGAEGIGTLACIEFDRVETAGNAPPPSGF